MIARSEHILLALVVCWLSVALVGAEAGQHSSAVLAFDREVVDFGRFRTNRGHNPIADVALINKSATAVKITGMDASCGCIRPDPIQASEVSSGGRIEVLVRLDLATMQVGRHEHLVVVYTGPDRLPTAKVRVQYEYDPEIIADAGELYLNAHEPGQPSVASTVLRVRSERMPTAARATSRFLTAALLPAPGSRDVILEVATAPDHPIGSIHSDVAVLDHQGMELSLISIHSRVTAPLEIRPKAVLLDPSVGVTGAHTRRLRIISKPGYSVARASASSSAIAVKSVSESEFELKIQPISPSHGRRVARESVTFEVAGPIRYKIEVPVIAHMKE